MAFVALTVLSASVLFVTGKSLFDMMIQLASFTLDAFTGEGDFPNAF